MPAYEVERSILISAPETSVRAAVEDFSEWPKWSPWLCMEPDTALEYYGTPGEAGHRYGWDGTLVGAGRMEIQAIESGRIDMDLNFLKPFKANAKVQMVITANSANESQVVWRMQGKMPFFLFFMTDMMKAMIGMDYDRGLKMLKDYVENGTVPSDSKVNGIVDTPAIHYLGVEARCAMKDIGPSMEKTLPEAFRLATKNNLSPAGPPGAIYHKVDFKKQTCHYAAVIPVASLEGLAAIDGSTNDTVTGTLAPGRALKATHTGAYRHLGNTWSTAKAYQRYKKLKCIKNTPCYEFYHSDPADVAEPDLITEIFLPLK